MRKTQLSCAIIAALASTSLAAQETKAPAKLETIEVTATKRVNQSKMSCRSLCVRWKSIRKSRY